MKKIAAIVITSSIFWACNTDVKVETSTDENIENIDTKEVAEVEVLNYFGEEITPEGAMASNELPAALEGKDSLNIKVEGTINACCQTKGCWMDVDLGNGESMIVKFKDYGFFVPKNASGQTAILEGVAKVETQTIDWLKHKALDAGKSQEEIDAITEPEVKVSFVANGVIIKGEIPVVEEDDDDDDDDSEEETEGATENVTSEE